MNYEPNLEDHDDEACARDYKNYVDMLLAEDAKEDANIACSIISSKQVPLEIKSISTLYETHTAIGGHIAGVTTFVLLL